MLVLDTGGIRWLVERSQRAAAPLRLMGGTVIVYLLTGWHAHARESGHRRRDNTDNSSRTYVPAMHYRRVSAKRPPQAARLRLLTSAFTLGLLITP